LKIIQGSVKLGQPVQQDGTVFGAYDDRSFEVAACQMVMQKGGVVVNALLGSDRHTDGTKQVELGCYSADNFWSSSGPKPFMWGSDCFLGNAVLPEGVILTGFAAGSGFDNLCQVGEIAVIKQGPYDEPRSNLLFQNDGARRVCGLKLSIAPGYACKP